MLRIIALAGLLVTLASPIRVSLIAAQGVVQASPYSIAMGPTEQTASVGQTVQYSVLVNSLLGPFTGSVLVAIPAGLIVSGQPYCSNGCGQPVVQPNASGSQIESSIRIVDDEGASFSFQVTVEPDVVPGISLQLAAYLLGGVNTAGSHETAFAFLRIVDASTSPTVLPLQDNRDAFLSVSPLSARLAPNGEVLYFIQPILWGMWQGAQPNYKVEVSIPAHFRLLFEPFCGPRTATIPMKNPCDATVAKDDMGNTIIDATPGFTRESTNSVYLILKLLSESSVNQALTLSFTMTVLDSTFTKQVTPVTAHVLLVDESQLTTPQFSNEVGGLIEARTDFIQSGDQCSSKHFDAFEPIGLYAYGSQELLAAEAPSSGRIMTATDGSGHPACFFSFSFENVPSYSVYMVATNVDSGLPPCRACVLGLITTTGHYADLVLVLPESSRP